MSATSEASCILYQNADKTIFLIDIPRSLENAQQIGADGKKWTILSSEPLKGPFPSLEPNQTRRSTVEPPTSISDLLLQRHLSFALEEIRGAHPAKWLFSRTTSVCIQSEPSGLRKRAALEMQDGNMIPVSSTLSTYQIESERPIGAEPSENEGIFFQNDQSVLLSLNTFQFGEVIVPPNSSFILGTIEETLKNFTHRAPLFDFVVMDPPWPNRSARRKHSYSTGYTSDDMMTLLSGIPLESHLAAHALVGVWITNKPVFRDLLTGNAGLFERWGLRLEEEWVWLKVTASGEPLCRLESTHRKPYEILLLGRKTDASQPVDIKRRVILGVPDLHSRKPNVRSIIETMLPSSYQALEIFARNLTAGWWAWGDEALKYQAKDYWIDVNI